MDIDELEFKEFNKVRASRGAEAAKFYFRQVDGDDGYMWLDRQDIKESMEDMNERFSEELQKGLDAYGKD